MAPLYNDGALRGPFPGFSAFTLCKVLKLVNITSIFSPPKIIKTEQGFSIKISMEKEAKVIVNKVNGEFYLNLIFF